MKRKEKRINAAVEFAKQGDLGGLLTVNNNFKKN